MLRECPKCRKLTNASLREPCNVCPPTRGKKTLLAAVTVTALVLPASALAMRANPVPNSGYHPDPVANSGLKAKMHQTSHTLRFRPDPVPNSRPVAY
jgi:hypothetical protein